MIKKKINVLDEIFADDYTDLIGLQNSARLDYMKKDRQLKNAVSKCYIDLKTYYDIKEKLDKNALERGLRLEARKPDEQRIKINRLFFDNLETIKELQEQGYTNFQIHAKLCESIEEFKDIEVSLMAQTIKQATLTSNSIIRKYDKYIDEIKQLLEDGNTPYYISKYLPQKYPDDDISWVSLGKYALEVKNKMESKQ